MTCAVVAPSLALAGPAQATVCAGQRSSAGPVSVTACVAKSLGKGTVSAKIEKSRSGARSLTVHWRYSVSNRGAHDKPVGWVPSNWAVSYATVRAATTYGTLKSGIGTDCVRLELYVESGGAKGRTVSNYTCQKSA
ncbi:hypothetical protein ACFO3J_00840 [Streptomyces polygonati]|uniref:Secreted protein n=1 Tax=Streptomyces polygonati TaxID=1617087 RepID=A0ABV8HGN0_9ACTN